MLDVGAEFPNTPKTRTRTGCRSVTWFGRLIQRMVRVTLSLAKLEIFVIFHHHESMDFER